LVGLGPKTGCGPLPQIPCDVRQLIGNAVELRAGSQANLRWFQLAKAVFKFVSGGNQEVQTLGPQGIQQWFFGVRHGVSGESAFVPPGATVRCLWEQLG
jgi:hypothetical protein